MRFSAFGTLLQRHYRRSSQAWPTCIDVGLQTEPSSGKDSVGAEVFWECCSGAKQGTDRIPERATACRRSTRDFSHISFGELRNSGEESSTMSEFSALCFVPPSSSASSPSPSLHGPTSMHSSHAFPSTGTTPAPR